MPAAPDVLPSAPGEAHLLAAARRLEPSLQVEEQADRVRWRDPASGQQRESGLHDYPGLYAVPGLYEAIFELRLAGGSPALLAEALAEVVSAAQIAERRVLDVGAGTGAVGARLWERGWRHLVGVDLLAASALALRRDRGEVYTAARALDLLRLDEEELGWLRGLGSDTVTTAGAVGFGHLPVGAFEVLTDLLPEGGLLAVTVARDWQTEPALGAHAAVLGGPAYLLRASLDGVHRRTVQGGEQLVSALVLERTDRVQRRGT